MNVVFIIYLIDVIKIFQKLFANGLIFQCSLITFKNEFDYIDIIIKKSVSVIKRFNNFFLVCDHDQSHFQISSSKSTGRNDST